MGRGTSGWESLWSPYGVPIGDYNIWWTMGDGPMRTLWGMALQAGSRYGYL
jgi:hypothetical protein